MEHDVLVQQSGVNARLGLTHKTLEEDLEGVKDILDELERVLDRDFEVPTSSAHRLRDPVPRVPPEEFSAPGTAA